MTMINRPVFAGQYWLSREFNDGSTECPLQWLIHSLSIILWSVIMISPIPRPYYSVTTHNISKHYECQLYLVSSTKTFPWSCNGEDMNLGGQPSKEWNMWHEIYYKLSPPIIASWIASVRVQTQSHSSSAFSISHSSYPVFLTSYDDHHSPSTHLGWSSAVISSPSTPVTSIKFKCTTIIIITAACA